MEFVLRTPLFCAGKLKGKPLRHFGVGTLSDKSHPYGLVPRSRLDLGQISVLGIRLTAFASPASEPISCGRVPRTCFPKSLTPEGSPNTLPNTHP